MIKLNCDHCGGEFEREKSRVKADKKRRQRENFCSRDCFAQSKIKKKTILSCTHCGEEFERSKRHIKKSKPVFCSRSCAAKYNNVKFPKRDARVVNCKRCKIPFANYGRKFCPSCIAKGLVRHDRPYGELTLKDLMGKNGKNMNSMKGKVHSHARAVVKDREKICVITGYTKHTIAAHIVPVNEFKHTTSVSVVNDERNLVLLSPNAHWELDKGLLDREELPHNGRFEEYLKELEEAGHLKE